MKPGDRSISRRDFLKLSAYSAVVGSVALLGGVEYITQLEPAWLDVHRFSLRLPHLAPVFSGLRLAHISDIHIGGWMNRERLEKVVQVILAENPDIIAITGDYLLGHGWDERREAALKDLGEILLPLVNIAPTLTVMGNHDYWTDPGKIRRKLGEIGIIELSNSIYSFKRESAVFHICGLDDVYEKRDRLDEIMLQLPSEGAAILLCHEPDFADISADTNCFDLQISGHTHGGQVVLPLVGPIHTPKHGHKYPLGLYQIGKMMLYTNRGVGMARIPVRFNCRPEITVIALKSGREGSA